MPAGGVGLFIMSEVLEVKEEIGVRMASNADGERIRDLLWAMGYRLLGIEWDDIEPYWIVAEFRGEVIGCLQTCPGKPMGRLELLAVYPDLSRRQTADIVKTLIFRGMGILSAQGSQAAEFLVPFEFKSYVKVLKHRGAEIVTDGHLMVKMLRSP